MDIYSMIPQHRSVKMTEVFQAKYIPRQRAIPPSQLFSGMATKALLASFPPLGQVTEILSQKTQFTVLLETDESTKDAAWEVSLRYSEGSEWKELQLAPQTSITAQHFSDAKTDFAGLKRLYFSAKLEVKSAITFTFKFRTRPEEQWLWIKEHQGAPDGVVILEKREFADERTDDLGSFIEGLDPSFAVKKCLSQSPNTSVWEVEVAVDAAVGDQSAWKKTKFGKPWSGDFLRWFALIRIWYPWLAPRQGKTHFELDKEAIVCSFLERGSGRHLVLLGISGIDDIMTLFLSDEDGNVVLNIRNDAPEAGNAKIIVALGNDFESANAAAMYQARDVVRKFEVKSGEEEREMQAMKDGVKPEWMENWFDGLTFCTWNALGQRLTEEKILKAVDALGAHNINITNLIIDDNWQSIDLRGHGQFQHGWVEFEADKDAFPNGLKHTITTLRKSHPNLQHIAVWHAILGYWAGISPDGKIAKTYKTAEVVRVDTERRNLPMGGKMTVVAAEDAFKMYDDFYTFLSSCGIDAVKTDAQFMLDTLESAKARASLFNTYLDAWTLSALKHFSIKAISCMSQTPQILFHSQLPSNKPPFLVRNSDDFFPEIPASHPWHVFTNACNSVFTQHLNVVPDWDMFQTVHDYSGFHAAARCVSGGPVYITDVPGQHNVALINEMTGQSPQGKTVIFRTSTLGKVLDPYVAYEDPVLLKISTYHGKAVTGTGMLGIFNTSPRPLSELLSLSMFPGMIEAQYYIVRSHSSGNITQPLQVVDYSPDALIGVSLDVRGYDILSAYPLRGFVRKGEDDTLWIANLGLLGKMAAPAAVVSTDMNLQENGRVEVSTNLKALGTLGLYISILPSFNGINGALAKLMVTISGQIIPEAAISLSASDNHVLEIDLMAAWKELGLKPGWSNEVQVHVSILP